jgi:hypothetical protein
MRLDHGRRGKAREAHAVLHQTTPVKRASEAFGEILKNSITGPSTCQEIVDFSSSASPPTERAFAPGAQSALINRIAYQVFSG